MSTIVSGKLHGTRRYWPLLLILLLIEVAAADAPKLSVQQAYELSDKGELVLVDVRSLQEWHETGVAPQAVTLSIHQPGGIPRFSEQLLALLDGDKGKPVALICASGVRSAHVQQYLKQQGFTDVLDVSAGMLGTWFQQGWIESGLPLESYKDKSYIKQ